MLTEGLPHAFGILALCALCISSCCAVVSSLDEALAYASKELQNNRDLLELASIPSISSLPQHAPDMLRAAKWLERRLKKAGLKMVKQLETGAQPIVYGEWLEAVGQPTALIYGHYDVQPVDPIGDWLIPPFEPVLANGSFWGRGVSDDKGGLLQALHAVEAYLQTSGVLPINVKFLLEGQEEVGSPNLGAALQEHAALLACDFAIGADGNQVSEAQGGVLVGLRGAAAIEVTLQTLDVDVHSGMKGGQILNPIQALAQLAASLHHPNNSIAVEGFYDGVVPITAQDEADMAAVGLDEAAEARALGAKGPHGEHGYSTLARRWLRPTLEMVGIYGGFKEEGIKTIVPAKASLKLAARLVPGQDPANALAAIERHITRYAHPLATVSFTRLGFHARPYYTSRDTVPNKAAAKVLGEVMGRPPLIIREGGTIPALALFKQHLGVDTTIFAFGLGDDRIHSPNERARASFYTKGREAHVRFLHELGRLASGSGPVDVDLVAGAVKDEL